MTVAGDCIVFIVDDDARIREALDDLFAAKGIISVSFDSIGGYLAFARPNLPGCLILDIELPDVNGLEFQNKVGRDHHPPIVFITGHGSIPSSVRAIKGGAVDFLSKPFNEADLINSVEAAISQDRLARAERGEFAALNARLASLTVREREVLPLIVSGLLNKQAAAELGISEVTLQIHRSKIMQKMEAASLADLVRAAEKLDIPVTHSRRRENRPQ
jgi:FixJ family two-component response regulator